jgi:outer membrane protein assembly factor BamD (BamD/ComL family)
VAAAPGASASAAGADPAPLSREESLRAERAILDVARTAVGRGQGAAALAALDRHAHDFPRGRLSEEREGMIIQALLMSGRSPEARSRLERFRKSFPRSMMLPALDAALGEGH